MCLTQGPDANRETVFSQIVQSDASDASGLKSRTWVGGKATAIRRIKHQAIQKGYTGLHDNPERLGLSTDPGLGTHLTSWLDWLYSMNELD
jgi:hypothetical protein